MKKQYGIITIVGNGNYGNRLQNYALCYALKKLDSEADIHTIWYNSWNKTIKDIFKKRLIFLKGKGEKKRYNNFSKFTNIYTNPTNKEYFVNSNLDELKNKFDKIIIGSDQIWNYTFFQEKFGYYEFAQFEEKSKCFSYSASFGLSSIPDEMKKTYQKGLYNLSHISVREEAGAKLVKEITGDNAEVVLDPTMLLTLDEWVSIELQPDFQIPEKYILTYFLGDKKEQQNKEINQLANDYNLKIINLNDKEQLNVYCCGPREFIYLFHNAEIIFTDSFHACVFSILFQKPFYVYNRYTEGMVNMNSRLDTLLGKFDLLNQKIESLNNITNVFEINYDHTIDTLAIEREKSYHFLLNALKN